MTVGGIRKSQYLLRFRKNSINVAYYKQDESLSKLLRRKHVLMGGGLTRVLGLGDLEAGVEGLDCLGVAAQLLEHPRPHQVVGGLLTHLHAGVGTR